MRKLGEVMVALDQKVDEKIKPFVAIFRRYFPVFSISLFVGLILFFVFRIFYNKPRFVAAVITSDITQIVGALNKIDKDCSILSIDNRRNYVDFLNVEKFSGSEIGCLNLAHPKNWRGPYLYDNPTLQGKTYEIIKTKEGIFVVPGSGVVLPNGLRMGIDVQISYKSAVSDMIVQGGPLNYKGKPLAAKLEFIIGDWQRKGLEPKEIEEINAVLEEFNTAMPFTHSQTAQYNC